MHPTAARADSVISTEDPSGVLLGGNARAVAAQPSVREIAADALGAGAFQLQLEASPDRIARAFLVYDLTGITHWTAVVRSINGLPALGGFGAAPSAETQQQIEEINPRWLRAGSNQILFFPVPAGDAPPSRVTALQRSNASAVAAPGGSVAYAVGNLRLVYLDGTAEPAPELRLTYPLHGEHDDAGTVLRGFVDPSGLPTGPAELFVNDTYIPQGISQADGSFCVFVPRPAADGAWEAQIEVVYPDGARLRRSVPINGEKSDDNNPDDAAELDADPESVRSFGVGKAHLDVTPGALSGKVKLTMRKLRREELAAMDAGMTNVTPLAGGFRLGPHGLRFRKSVTLNLPYDSTLIPKGMTADDVRTYFFNEQAGRWFPVPRLEAKAGTEVIVSTTNHFTDFVNATLALPDEPAGINYSSNSLKELAKADPASNVEQIEPPEGGPTGDAMLDFPLVVPPGRRGLEPKLSVHYGSGGGNGWLGVGWDLQLPSIEISTLFGVPRYDGTETYLIDGEQLAATSSPGTFVRRSEGTFDRIVRQGSGPADYSWEVTDKDGNRFLYGQSAQARLRDGQSGNIFRWYLEREIDLHGNTVDYFYVTDQGGGGADGEPWTQIYPARIDYTGTQGAGAFYHVVFSLDDGSRPDRLSSGRQGFKTYTRRRLEKVDVLAGSDLVRRYLLAYREGDFHKSLLASIAVTGEGGTAEFYRHTFDYVRMAEAGSADGYAGFGAPQAWGGIGSGKDFTDSFRVGGGAHAFVGLGPPGCQPHAGVQAGGSGSDTSQRVSFLDVNGDGLPDRIDENGNVDVNQYDPLADPDGSLAGHFGAAHFDNADVLGHTSEWSLDLGLGAHLETGVTATLGANWVWSHANDDHIVTDLNGDMRPDLVSTDGGFSVRVNDGHSFVPRAGWSGFAGQGLNLGSAGEETEVLSNFHLANALRQLVVPYDGHVTLSGVIQKKESTGDGVDVAIFQNDIPIWSRRFAAGDTVPCVPGPGNSCSGGLSQDVRAGDSFYFLAGSVRDTTGDALLWAPNVSYDGADAQAREPYGARTFVFDARDDFRLAGYNGAGWSSGASGAVHVTGAFNKQETSDDVVVSVLLRPRAGVLDVPVYAHTFAASESATSLDIPAINVTFGDLLFLRISSRTPIDPNRVLWTPMVTFDGTTDPPSLPDAARTGRAQVAIAIPALSPANDPTRSLIVQTSGPQTLGIRCSRPTGVPATLLVQGVNRLLAALDLPQSGVPGFPVTNDVTVPVTASAGDPLFVTLLFSGPASGSCVVNGAFSANVRWPGDVSSRVLSGGHHGWFYGEWNGDVPFTRFGLVPPQSKDDKPNFMPGSPHWEGTKQFAAPVWTAGGFDLYLASEGVKPSRKGANAAGVIDQASGTAGGGLSVLRKNTTRTEALSASVGAGGAGAGLSLSHGKSETQLDILDINGDRYPDQVSADGVRFSNGKDGFGPLQSFPGLDSAVRASEDANVGITASLGVTFNKKDGKGKAKAVLSTLPSVGNTVSLSQTRYDLIDVNGDGLPDRVSMEPGSGVMTVRLNLGYKFGAPETWSLPRFDGQAAPRCTDAVDYASSSLGDLSGLDTLNAISFTRSSSLQAGAAIGPFGGGASTTLARTLMELVDVNGDGLPDRVAKDANDAFFRVQLNLGDHWDREQRWYVPGWSTSIGDGYNPGGIFKCLDAVTFSGNVEVDGSAGAPICIPLIPPIPVVGLQIEVSAQVSGTINSGAQLFFEDIDGDGLPDHILKKAGDPNVYVKRNQADRVNLLSAVHRPLGSTVELSYQRRGNHADMPFNQWVLSEVRVTDGRGTPPYVTRYQYGNNAFYDRTERENYGFAHVRITQPDGSTIDRDFLNRDLYSRHLKTKEVLADASGNLFRAESSHYEEAPVAGAPNARFPALLSETTSFYEGTTAAEASAPKSTGRTYEYDGLGNIVRTTDSGDAGIDDDVIATAVYRIDSDKWLTRPANIEVRDGAGRLLRARQGTYSPAGDLTRLEQTLAGGRDPDSGTPYSGTKNAVWSYTFDDVGNVATVVDAAGFTSTLTYDAATRSHATKVDDAFGYSTRFTYDLKYGQLTETVDQNGNSLRRAYDTFGRIVRVAGPDDSDTAPALALEYGLGAPISWAVVHMKDVTRSDTIDTSTFIDSLEREIQTKADAELDLGSGTSTRIGTRVSGHVDFDTRGRVASQGQPTFDDHPINQFVDVPAKNPTTYVYDILDRVRTARYPNGAVTRIDYGFGSLDGNTRLLTTRTDPNGRATRFYRDVRDGVLGVEQSNTIGGARKTLVTRYAYDALEQLTAVADPKGNTTRLEYDTLGHRVTLASPDAGRTEYRYDPAGHVRAQITANLAAGNQQVRYLYTFNRLDRIDYPNSPDVLFTYGGPGAPFNQANRVAAIADASGVEQRSYDKLGNLVLTTKTAAALNGTTPKGPYTTRFAFDSFGRLLSLVYPDGETLTYGYDAGGKVKTASGVNKGVRFEYLRHLGYDEFGKRVRIVSGNGVESRFTYDPQSRYVSQLRTIGVGRDLQNLRYQYDLTGTIQAIQNDVPLPAAPLYGGPATQTFRYDDLYQLVAANGIYRGPPNKQSTYALSLVYDEAGNTIAKNQLSQTANGNANPNTDKKTSYNWAYAYGSAQPHAPSRIGDRTYRYDLNGNQTGWDSTVDGTRRNATWNEENRLLSVADNGQTTSFLYDAAGSRTNKAGPNGETIYVNRWFSIRNGAIASKHVFADDTRVSTKVSPDPNPPSEKVYFYHADHLGSAQFVTDQTGAAYEHLEYFPSGEIWIDEHSDTQRTPYLFSGKELDDETGLSYFGHRYYEARQGQWVSADPILDGMLDARQLTKVSEDAAPFRLAGNIYGYTSNDPVNNIDELGLDKRKLASIEVAGTFTPVREAGGAQRLQSVSATITTNELDGGTGTNAKIRKYAQDNAGPGHSKPDAGHLIARRLGGPGNNEDNIIPQEASINRGAYRVFEDEVYHIIDEHGQADVTVTLHYPAHDPNTLRPERIEYVVHYEDAAGQGWVRSEWFDNE